jgi:hypothetical protein
MSDPHIVVGYTGTIDDVLAQIRAEPDEQAQHISARAMLLRYLGVDRMPSLEDNEDWSVEITGAPQPENKFSLEYAFDHGFIQAPQK